jgi:hypothetical protein
MEHPRFRLRTALVAIAIPAVLMGFCQVVEFRLSAPPSLPKSRIRGVTGYGLTILTNHSPSTNHPSVEVFEYVFIPMELIAIFLLTMLVILATSYLVRRRNRARTPRLP